MNVNLAIKLSLLVSYGGRAAWLAAGSGIASVIPLAVWILYLGKKYPGHTILNILKLAFGKYIYGCVSVVYILINAV